MTENEILTFGIIQYQDRGLSFSEWIDGAIQIGNEYGN